jgi:protocatechuate 3,4-dioxygenase beta subunit
MLESEVESDMRRCAWLLSIGVVAVPLAAVLAQTPELAPATAPAQAVIAPASETGERLVIRGRVLDRATGNAVPGASVYLYQTDASGLYTRDGSNDNRNPRLHTHLRTDRQGGFEAVTIRPGPYPRGGVPAHIHVVVHAPGFGRREFEFVFDDDPLVDTRIRERSREPSPTYVIARARQENGAGRIEYDILLDRS